MGLHNEPNTILICRYGELVLKGKNRLQFVKQLKKNVKQAFKKLSITNPVDYQFDMLVVGEVISTQRSLLKNLFTRLPGLSVCLFALQIPHDEAQLLALLQQVVQSHPSFKIEVRRRDKLFACNSSAFKKYLALQLWEKYQLKGKLVDPAITVHVEVTKEHFLIISESFNGIGGLPVFTSGTALALLSGGIDSPVAASLVLQRGFNVDFITFINEPGHNAATIGKIQRLANLVSLNQTLCTGRLFVFDFTDLQKELSHISLEGYRIVLMRRCFYKIASLFKYDCLITGEALGQVASQTIDNLKVIQTVVPNTFVIRPLIGLSKDKIIEWAKALGTFETSIEHHMDTCTVFAPKKPTTKAKLAIVEKLESELLFVRELIEAGVKKLQND